MTDTIIAAPVSIIPADRFSGIAAYDTIRQEARGAPRSGIGEVANYGRGRQGLIPLWVGEGDLPTPGFIVEAANKALADGETFYTWQRGLPELRTTIADYMTRVYGPLFGKPYDPERFTVTIGGMHALQVAMRMIAGIGDEVLVPSPAWTNFMGVIAVGGATPVPVPMTLDPAKAKGGWYLDMERLADAVTPRTRWIVADEIYGRFVYDGAARAPSFHDIMDEDDRIMFVQTCSKNWAMTGWRIGWLECNAAFGSTVESLLQYSSSGVASFIQRAAIVALEQGEDFIAHQIDKAERARDVLC